MACWTMASTPRPIRIPPSAHRSSSGQDRRCDHPSASQRNPCSACTERVHVEWPVTMGGTRTVRLLGRRGDVLPIPIAVSERDGRDGGVVVMADLSLSPIAQGDYAMEITTKNGADTVTRLFAFRVAR